MVIAGAMLQRLDAIGCRGILAMSVFIFFITILHCSSSSSSSSSALLDNMVIVEAMLERLDTIACRGIFATSFFFFTTVLDSSSLLLLLVHCRGHAGEAAHHRLQGHLRHVSLLLCCCYCDTAEASLKCEGWYPLVLRLCRFMLTLFRSACCDLVRSASSLDPACLEFLGFRVYLGFRILGFIRVY